MMTMITTEMTMLYELCHVKYAKTHEPGILKYAICGTADNSDLDTIYVIEEYDQTYQYSSHYPDMYFIRYASQSAYDHHFTVPPVQDTLTNIFAPSSTSATTPSVLASAPIIHNITWTPAHFTRPTLSTTPDPFIIWATIDLPSVAQVDTIAPYGAAVVKHAEQSEEGCLFYGDARPRDKLQDDKGLICAVEVYQDEAAFQYHSEQTALQAMVKEATTLGSRVVFAGLKLEAGWLARDMEGVGDAEHDLRDGTKWMDQ